VLIAKTICGRIEKPTKFKFQCIEHEYNGFQQWMIFGIDQGIYSTYKVGKIWKRKTINYQEYPIIMWAQWMKFEQNKSGNWLLFKTKLKRGGIWLPIKLYQPIPTDCTLKDSQLVYNHKKDLYEVRLVFSKEFKANNHKNILAIDIGEKVMATVVCGDQTGSHTKPYFFGKEIRGIRRHYSWLRKRLGERKLLKMIKKMGQNERNKVNSLLHEITKKILLLCYKHNVGYIFLGDLKDMRELAKNKGRRMRRIVSNFTYNKFREMLRYKAEWNGIQVIEVNEAYSSQNCSRCSNIGKRPYQGLFKCSVCNSEMNADYNAVKNIYKRGIDYISMLGASAYALNPSTETGSI